MQIKPVIEELGFTKPGDAYGWHAFRHGAGTTLWDLTRDKLTVRDLLRHGNTSITERYMHGSDPRLQEAQAKLIAAILSPTPQPNQPPPPTGTALQMPERRVG